MIPKGALYLPALSTDLFIKKPVYLGEDKKTLGWWRENDVLNYKSLLYSFYFSQQFDLRDYFGIGDDSFLFGDSGGFSVVSQDAKIDAENVIKWQLLNCDAGVILDIPPYSFSGKAQFGGNAAKKFVPSLHVTVQNIQRAREYLLRKRDAIRPEFQWWGVIQGETYEQKEEWYSRVWNEYQFEGCALSPKPSYDVVQIASHMTLAYRKGIKRLHVLQVTGKTGVATIIYLMKMWGEPFELVTFDSSTYARQAAIRRYMKSIDDYAFIEKAEELECTCPVCSRVKNSGVFLESTGEAVWILALHNLWKTVQEIEKIKAMEPDELYKKYINNTIVYKFARTPEKQIEIERLANKREKSVKQSVIFDFCSKQEDEE